MSIEARHINRSFGTYRALDDVSLEIPDGCLVSLLGPSGSGKTTLLRILAGLDLPDPRPETRILFHGEDVTTTPAGRRGVGFVFQHYALFRHMTVGDNVAFGLRAKPRATRPGGDAIRKRVAELLALVQLDGMEKRFPAELSGGQRQRVALARALAVEPKVLLLDEPFGALDAKVRKELRRWLRTFQAEIGITSIFVTHDQEEALEIADEVVVMNNAHIAQRGSPQDVYDRPASPFVIEFLGNVNRLAGGLAGAGTDDPVYVRPHDVDISLEPADGHSLAARVLHVFSAGNYARVSLERLPTHEHFEAEIPREKLERLGLVAGQQVWVVFRHVRLFGKDGGFRVRDLE